MKEIFKGALLGFALGDALGNSVADLSKKEIQNRWGSSGINRPNRHPVLHSFSNSGLTEEMCFILDGLLWANRVFMDPFLPVKRSMYRWLYNTTKLLPSPDDEIWLKRQPHEEKNSIFKHQRILRRNGRRADVFGSPSKRIFRQCGHTY